MKRGEETLSTRDLAQPNEPAADRGTGADSTTIPDDSAAPEQPDPGATRAAAAEERERLEAQRDRGEDISTEDLRVTLQRYRSFFQRLLSA